MYKIKFPIGDWSSDGHGKCLWYTVESNKPVEEVREIHYQIKEKLGINIEEIASEFEDNSIPNEQKEILENVGLSEFFYYDGEKYTIEDTETMIKLWLSLLKLVDKELEVNLIDNDIPTINFYGFDKQKRHIGFVGYGLFWD